jgi:hypothetical protein
VYALLSNGIINQILNFQFDFTDDEVVANYISLVKGIAVVLTPDTV